LGLLIPIINLSAAESLNTLTQQERAGGWKLLFDGKSLEGWRGFKKTEPPSQGWVVEEGVLKHTDKGGGGDIITREKFSEFDLVFEWKVAPGANSGVKYFILEERKGAIGHEYQLIDDARHADALRGPKWQTGSFYDVFPPAGAKARPVGEWNTSRILVKGNHVEHWLNGDRIVTYELGSPETLAAVAQSKFKTVAGFGTAVSGHILLQDHGDEISFRNIRIKPGS
jgi:hypothetical protein